MESTVWLRLPASRLTFDKFKCREYLYAKSFLRSTFPISFVVDNWVNNSILFKFDTEITFKLIFLSSFQERYTRLLSKIINLSRTAWRRFYVFVHSGHIKEFKWGFTASPQTGCKKRGRMPGKEKGEWNQMFKKV